MTYQNFLHCFTPLIALFLSEVHVKVYAVGVVINSQQAAR